MATYGVYFHAESTPFVLEVLDVNENAIIISWSQNSRSITVSDAVQTFSLTVNHGSSSQVISLNDSFYNFTAPEDAPPCEVYNFSVTATYVGATYTGAGCSVPSPVLSTMLPSLPDLGRLESSLHYSLVKDSEDLTLNVSFEVCFVVYIINIKAHRANNVLCLTLTDCCMVSSLEYLIYLMQTSSKVTLIVSFEVRCQDCIH